MGTGKGITFTPRDAQLLVDREFKNTLPHQYLRELLKNSIEAGAKRVEFTPEWSFVQQEGVYRLKVADNGCGMTASELDRYMASFGASAKTVGLRANFGIGARMTLLPWNKMGVVVLSWTKEYPQGLGMVMHESENGNGYEMEAVQGDDSIDGYDIVSLDSPQYRAWASMKPDFIEDHGTVIVCMGNTGEEDTFFGPDGYSSAPGCGLKYIVRQLNDRFYAVPTEVRAACFYHADREYWPDSSAEYWYASDPARKDKVEALTRRPDAKHLDKVRVYQLKEIQGAEHYLTKSQPKSGTCRTLTGEVELSDGAVAQWIYRAGDLPDNHAFVSDKGFIAALYDGELYERSSKLSSFRNFGIGLNSVAERTFLIVHPPPRVFPGSTRRQLALEREDGNGADSLPWTQWADEFYSKFPAQLNRYMTKYGVVEYSTNLEKMFKEAQDLCAVKCKLVTVLGRRRRRCCGRRKPSVLELELRKDCKVMEPTTPDDPERQTDIDAEEKPGAPTKFGIGTKLKPKPKSKSKKKVKRTPGSLPPCTWVSSTELQDSTDDGRTVQHFPAHYDPPRQDFPEGLLQIAYDHPMIEAFQNELMEGVHPSVREEVVNLVRGYFGIRAGYYIAYSNVFSNMPGWGMGRVRTELWSQAALFPCFVPDPDADRALRKFIKSRFKRKKGA